MTNETNEPSDTPANDKGDDKQGLDTASSDSAPIESDTDATPEQTRIAELELEVNAVKDKMLRAVADMENLRRRTEKEKADTAKFAITKFARDILTVGDNIDRAIKSVDEAACKDPALHGFMEGVKMIDRELINVLERHGITIVNPDGALFDPNLHQAIFEAPKEGVNDGTVIEVIQVGYMIEERILRPAMVGVAKNPKSEKASS